MRVKRRRAASVEAEVLIAVDSLCGFSRRLLHAAGAKSRSPAMLVHLYAAILAQATNLGPVAMARSLRSVSAGNDTRPWHRKQGRSPVAALRALVSRWFGRAKKKMIT